MKYLWPLLFPMMAFGATEIDDARTSIQSLIRPLLPGSSKERPKGTEKFRVDACPKEKINWMNVLMMKEKATLNYKFQEGCDIEGTIEPKVFQSFPVSLKLRNIQNYNQVNTQNKVTAQIDSKPILNLEMREGFLIGPKSKVRFEADYKVQIDPMNPKKVDKNLGGELRISEINGKKVSIKEKILVE